MYSFILTEIYPTINIFPLQNTLRYLTNSGNQVFTLFLNYLRIEGHIEGTKCIFMMLKELFTVFPFHKFIASKNIIAWNFQHYCWRSKGILPHDIIPKIIVEVKSEIKGLFSQQWEALICVCFLDCSVPNTYNTIWQTEIYAKSVTTNTMVISMAIICITAY